jgi:hypothetical protein
LCVILVLLAFDSSSCPALFAFLLSGHSWKVRSANAGCYSKIGGSGEEVKGHLMAQDRPAADVNGRENNKPSPDHVSLVLENIFSV